MEFASRGDVDSGRPPCEAQTQTPYSGALIAVNAWQVEVFVRALFVLEWLVLAKWPVALFGHGPSLPTLTFVLLELTLGLATLRRFFLHFFSFLVFCVWCLSASVRPEQRRKGGCPPG